MFKYILRTKQIFCEFMQGKCNFTTSSIIISVVIACWLRVREVLGSILSQGSLHTKDVIKWYPCLALNIIRETLALSKKKCLYKNTIFEGLMED